MTGDSFDSGFRRIETLGMRFVAPLCLAFAVALAARGAQAQTSVELQLNPEAARVLEQQGIFTTSELTRIVDEELRAIYGLLDVPTFLRLSANAQGMANKGLGVDYASNPDRWIFGVSVAVAADAGDASLDDVAAFADGNTDVAVPISAGAQIGLMVGYKATDRLTVFANGMYYPLDAGDFDGTFYNAGVHLQYKAIPPIGRRQWAQWGGLDLTTGFQLSSMRLALSERFEASGTIEEGFDLDSVSTGTLELTQRAFTLPFEATTNVTLLYVVTLYAGIGLDVQLGDASMNVDLDSDLTTADPVAGGPLDLGSAQIRADDVNDPNLLMFRLMGGVQINIWRLKLFAQLNILTEDLTLSLAAGLRLVL